jgi:hypothetical protein
MEASRFDALARVIGSRISRRVAVGLAATGLMARTGQDAAALRCSKNKPCPECHKCKDGKCKPKRLLSRCTEGGTCCSPDLCCPKEQTCSSTGTSCEACPETTDFCTNGFPVCGYFGKEKNQWCGCITSVEGATTCSSLFFACFSCTTDQQCTDEFGLESICTDLSGCGLCSGKGGKACMIKDCVKLATTAAVQSEAVGGLERLSGARPAR